jgi:hypothetical protein
VNPRDDTAVAAVRRLYGCTAPQALCSLAVLCGFVAGAAWLQRPSLIGLFAAILGPMLLACCILLLCARLAAARLGWPHAWVALLGTTGAGALAVLAPYHAWMAAHGLPGLPDLQVLACAFGSGVLALGLPLWQAQATWRARTRSGRRRCSNT